MLISSEILSWEKSIFHKQTYFRHLKLGIALAIPASKERKIETNDSAGQVFKCAH